MANYNKSFNFRNGVQVDNDNFVVNTAGLVGIGTSIPSAFLDVYGTSNLRGDVSATGNVTSSGITSTQYLNVVGFSTLQSLSAVGGNYSGVVTATKYVGDGSALSGVFAVSASGWYFEPGSPGVAYTTSKVGIGTTNAETFLQIGGDEVDSNTELRLGKRVTATETSFPAIAQVSSTGSDNSLGLSARTPLGSIIFYTGNGTWGSGTNTEKVRIQSGGNVGIGSTSPTERLDVRGTTRSTILNITGVSTFTGDVSASGNLNVTGVTTFNQDVKFPGAAYNVEWDQPTSKFKFDDNAQCVFGTASGGDLRIFHAGGNSTIKNETGQFRIAGNDIRLQTQDNSEDYLLAVDGGSVSIFHNDVKRLETTGSGVDITDTLNVAGVSTFNDTLQVFKSSSAIIAVGKSTNIDGYNGQLRFGHTIGSFKYSDGESLDVINYSPGSFNFISNPDLLDDGKDFQWLVGENADPKMTLTGIGGSLGIGITTPISAFHVVGISTFAGDATISGDLSVRDNITIDTGNLTITTGSFVGNVKGDVLSPDGTTVLDNGTGSGTDALLVANVNTTSGVSTFGGVNITGLTTTSEIRVYGSVGIGTTLSRSVADFDASVGLSSGRYIIPPILDNTARSLLINSVGGGATVTGAIIYNTDAGKLQVYTGSAWETITSS